MGLPRRSLNVLKCINLMGFSLSDISIQVTLRVVVTYHDRSRRLYIPFRHVEKRKRCYSIVTVISAEKDN